jgi:hypothetical protein
MYPIVVDRAFSSRATSITPKLEAQRDCRDR